MALSLQKKLYGLLNQLLSLVPWASIVSKIEVCCWTLKARFRLNLSRPIEDERTVLHHCGSTSSVDEEVKVIVNCITNAYVKSWYHSKVSQNTVFITDVNCALYDTLTSFCNSFYNVERSHMACQFSQLYLHFLMHFKQAITKVSCGKGPLDTCLSYKEEIYQKFGMHHRAMKDNMTEWCYLQSITTILIDAFGPVDLLSCPMLHTLIVEILTQNVIYPLVNALSDPNRLNLLMAKLMRIELYPQSIQNISPVLTCVSDTKREETLAEEEESRQYTEERQSMGSENNVEFKFSELSETIQNTPVSPIQTNTLCVPVTKALSNLSLHCINSNDVPSTASGNFLDAPHMKRSKSADYIKEGKLNSRLMPLNSSNRSIRLQNRDDKMFFDVTPENSVADDIEFGEEASEVPPLFTDISIIDVQQHEDPGHIPYTLYCIQYSGLFQDISSNANIPVLVRQVMSIKRRFREFLTLHSRLENNSTLKPFLKGIKGPSKGFPAIFLTTEKKNIAERKIFLESYLKVLCKHSTIMASAELQEFLAYGGDASIAYVKKNSDINVPRIDKMILKGVKDAMDIFRLALPVPFEGLSNNDTSIFAVDAFNNKMNPVETKFQEVSLTFDDTTPGIVEHIDEFFSKQERDSSTGSTYNETSALQYEQHSARKMSVVLPINHIGCNCTNTVPVTVASEVKNLGSVLIDIMVESSRIPPNQSALLYGQILNSLVSPSVLNDFVENKLKDINEEKFGFMLHIFHNSMWPKERTPPRGNTGSLAPMLKNAVVDKLKHSMGNNMLYKLFYQVTALTGISDGSELLLASLQHEVLNKCLLYYFFDALIENLCPSKSS